MLDTDHNYGKTHFYALYPQTVSGTNVLLDNTSLSF